MAKLIGKTRELTAQECAAELGVSVATVYRRIKRGWFHDARKVGGRWIITGPAFRLVEVTDGGRAAAHYEHLSWTVPYDGSHLKKMADEYRAAGRTEHYVYNAFFVTRAEADAEAERRNAATTVPGITYYSAVAA